MGLSGRYSKNSLFITLFIYVFYKPGSTNVVIHCGINHICINCDYIQQSLSQHTVCISYFTLQRNEGCHILIDSPSPSCTQSHAPSAASERSNKTSSLHSERSSSSFLGTQNVQSSASRIKYTPSSSDSERSPSPFLSTQHAQSSVLRVVYSPPPSGSEGSTCPLLGTHHAQWYASRMRHSPPSSCSDRCLSPLLTTPDEMQLQKNGSQSSSVLSQQ